MASNANLNQQRFVLNNGTGEIPALGFGTSRSDNRKTRDAVRTAVQMGFRHLDAAERYRNEAEVDAGASTVRPARSTVACAGTRSSPRVSMRPRSAESRRRANAYTVSPSGTLLPSSTRSVIPFRHVTVVVKGSPSKRSRVANSRTGRRRSR